MKKTTKTAIAVILSLIFIISLVACDTAKETETPETTTAPVAEVTTPAATVAGEGNETEPADENTVEATGIWANAKYLKDMEFGNGAKTVVVEVKADDQTVTFTIKTDKTTVGEALMEHGLIAGEEGAYGLYVKDVNGMTADYDVDQTYWAFYINGDYGMTGVDMTEINEADTYQLERTKG